MGDRPEEVDRFMSGLRWSADAPNVLVVMTNGQLPAPSHPTYAHDAGAAGNRPFPVGKMPEPEPAR
jgi:hypothetical protein